LLRLVLEQEGERLMDRWRRDDVVIVQHQDDGSFVPDDIVDEQSQDDFGSRGPWGLEGMNGRFTNARDDRLYSSDEIIQEANRIVVVFIQ